MKRIISIIMALLCMAAPLAVIAADVYEVAEKHTYQNADTTIPYRLLLPDNYDKNGSYPMLLFLHGSGERGNDNELQFFNCVQTIYDTIPEDCIIVVPQCPLNQQWVDVAFATGTYSTDSVPESNELKAVVELVKQLTESHAVDTDRIYAAGLSMGGYGTWDLMVRHNDIFAAAIAICGGGDASKYELLKHTPLFVFHGDVDATVPVSGSRNIVNAIKNAGGKLVEYTEFTGWGHGVWNKTFQTEGLLEKLLSCRLSDRYPAASNPDISGTINGGKTNVALGATATVSGLEVNDGRFTPDLAVDGDASTRVSFANDVDEQWLLLDLGKSYDISSIEIVFKEHVSAYEVQLSENGTNFTKVYEITDGTEANAVTDIIPLSSPVSARYIKYIQHKRWYASAWNKYYSGGIFEFCAFVTDNGNNTQKYTEMVSMAKDFVKTTPPIDSRYEKALRYSDQLNAYIKAPNAQIAKAEGLYEALEAVMNSAPEYTTDNLVFGNSYTTSIAVHADYPDESGRDLTNGIIVTHEDNQTTSPYNDARWLGFNVGTARSLDVVVPLGDGKTLYDLGRVEVNIGGDKLSAGVTEPDVTVYYTADGVSYKRFGSYKRTGEDKYAFNVVIEPEKSVKAIGIKVNASLVNCSNKNLVWLGEIAAYEGDPAEPEPEPTPEPEYILGDVNNDKKVDSVDYLLVKRSCFNTYALSNEERVRANVNQDNNINSVDYVLIKRIVFGTFTAPEISKPQISPANPDALLPEKSTYNLLFIGNSATYVNDIPATLASLCAEKGITINQTQMVTGGNTLALHAADSAVLAEIAKGYDAVFLQENGNSMTTTEASEESLRAISILSAAVHSSGAKLYFYVRPPYGINLSTYDTLAQCELFDDHFNTAAEKFDASCVYVNRAFAYVRTNLDYYLWGPDDAHTNTYGAYLAVCTFYATLFGESATTLGVAYNISAEDAAELQQSADKIAFDGVIPWES